MMEINKGWKSCFEKLLENEKKLVHSSEEAPQLELKPLPVVLNMHISVQVS